MSRLLPESCTMQEWRSVRFFSSSCSESRLERALYLPCSSSFNLGYQDVRQSGLPVERQNSCPAHLPFSRKCLPESSAPSNDGVQWCFFSSPMRRLTGLARREIVAVFLTATDCKH